MSKYKPLHTRWTPEEDIIIKSMYPSESIAEIARRIHRTAQTVKARAKTLGIKKGRAQSGIPWTEREIKKLKHNIEQGSEFNSGLDRTALAAKCKSVSLGFIKTEKAWPRWRRKEDVFLKRDFRSLGISECARILNRSSAAISGRACVLKLSSSQGVDPKKLDSVSNDFWIYLAGFIDADGWIGILQGWNKGSPNFVPTISISNGSEKVHNWIQEKLSEGGIRPRGHIGKRECRYGGESYDHFQLYISSRFRVRSILEKIKKYLIVKIKTAEAVLKFMDERKWGRITEVRDWENFVEVRRCVGSRKLPHKQKLEKLEKFLIMARKVGLPKAQEFLRKNTKHQKH